MGVFNRITFPAYFLVPGFKLLGHFRRRPLSLFIIAISGVLFTSLAISLDSSFYHHASGEESPLTDPSRIVITPLNSLLYNARPSNLSKHGLHPLWTHLIGNLPLLLGPVVPLLLTGLYRKSMRLGAAVGGIVMLSAFPHQEARFLIPAVPLILSATKAPSLGKQPGKTWWIIWFAWNAIMGIGMGVYHQGGIVPMQIHIAHQSMTMSKVADASSFEKRKVFWWKTYMTPIWLLDGQIGRVDTVDLMGAKWEDVKTLLEAEVPSCKRKKSEKHLVELVTPYSMIQLDSLVSDKKQQGDLILQEEWRYEKHISLDDLDIAGDGVWGTLGKVWKRRGLVMWKVDRQC
jgi:phosphatidylinositol glycan class Z